MADSVEIELLPLTEMITKLFGGDFVEFIKNKHKRLRSFYETSTTATQCGNTVGKPISGVTPCWICGYNIIQSSNEEDAFSPECEHIFPISQAIFFIGLYTNDVKNNAQYVEKLKLEYDWAHRVCNQIKNDSHFIEHNIQRPDGRWSISRPKIEEFLRDILARGNIYGQGATLIKDQIRQEGLTIDQWINNRTNVIEQKSAAILRTIQPKNENLWILTTISDLAHSYQTSGFVPDAIEPYMPISKPGQVIVMDQQEASRTYAMWSEFIMKHVNQYGISYLAERTQRFTPEQKAMRSQKVIMLLDKSLISKAAQQLWVIYNKIPNDVNKQVRFVEGVQYIISSIVIDRLNRIFTDPSDAKSTSLQTLASELRRNLEAIKEIWNANRLSPAIDYFNHILSTELKGAARRKRRV